MFFNFFSEKHYPEESWIPLWNIEKSIQALLLEFENHESYKSCALEELSKIIEQEVLMYDLIPMDSYYESTLQLLPIVIKDETENILKFIGILSFEDMFQPFRMKETAFFNCLNKSTVFREYIERNGKTEKNKLQPKDM